LLVALAEVLATEKVPEIVHKIADAVTALVKEFSTDEV